MPRAGIEHQLIVDTAMEMIQKNGYHSLSLREVAAKIGIKPASIYNHVKGIDEIRLEVAKKVASDINHTIETAIQGLDREEAFKQAIKAYRDYALKNEELYKAMIRMPKDDPHVTFKVGLESFQAIRELIFNEYQLDRVQRVTIMRALRSEIHGYVELQQLTFFNVDSDSIDMSYDLIVQKYLDILLESERKYIEKGI